MFLMGSQRSVRGALCTASHSYTRVCNCLSFNSMLTGHAWIFSGETSVRTLGACRCCLCGVLSGCEASLLVLEAGPLLPVQSANIAPHPAAVSLSLTHSLTGTARRTARGSGPCCAPTPGREGPVQAGGYHCAPLGADRLLGPVWRPNVSRGPCRHRRAGMVPAALQSKGKEAETIYAFINEN